MKREQLGNSRPEDFTITFNPPINLDRNSMNDVALDVASMTYSWHNIGPESNNDTLTMVESLGMRLRSQAVHTTSLTLTTSFTSS